MRGELKLEKDLAELSVPKLLDRLNSLTTLDGGDSNEEEAEQEDVSNTDETASEESLSENDSIVDANDVLGLHRLMVRRSERLQQVDDRVEPLEQALHEFEKGYEVSNRATADDVDVDDTEDEDYRPSRRERRRINVALPLWQRQPEIARLYQRRVRRIQRLHDRSDRLDRKVQTTRAQWQAALDTRARLEREEQRLREKRSREQKDRERRWIEDFQRQESARRHKEERKRDEAARRQREREEAVEKLERLKYERTENQVKLQSYRDALKRAHERGSRGSRPGASLFMTLTVVKGQCEKKSKEYDDEIAKLEPPPRRANNQSGPSVQKYARDDRFIEEGDLEYDYNGAP
jgi:hypothetical protein